MIRSEVNKTHICFTNSSPSLYWQSMYH